MKLNAILVAGVVALASTIAVAQTVVAPAVVPVVAVDPNSWQGWLGQAYTALVDIAVLAVPVVGGFLATYLRSKSKLAGVLLSQALLDKLVLGIQNQIRAEAEKLKDHIPGVPDGTQFNASNLTLATKKDIATAVEARIKPAFKETLDKLKPADLHNMILGHIEPALKATPVPPVAIPAIMARS